MAFKKLVSLDAETLISLGGYNKKLRKDNPSTIEGYYLGSRNIPDKKKKSGISTLHFFQTETGNVGIYGKANTDKQLPRVRPGTMTRVTHTGFQSTPNGEMYVYLVETDKDNTIDVGDYSEVNVASTNAVPEAFDINENEDVSEEETGLDEEETALDEVKVAPARRPATVSAPSAEAQARTRALLNGRSNRSTA